MTEQHAIIDMAQGLCRSPPPHFDLVETGNAGAWVHTQMINRYGEHCMLKRRTRAIPLAVALLVLATTADLTSTTLHAEEFGDADRGRDFAEKTCSECHAVRKENGISPRVEAPPFKAIADLPSTTRMALTVWFRSPHPTMPNLVLSAEETDNVIAYILSLK